MNLSEQFFGTTEISEWILDQYSNAAIETLIDKIPYKESTATIFPHFWTIGPSETMSGIWLYGQSDIKNFFNFKRKIISITYVNPNNIIVFDYNKVGYMLNKKYSASSLARTLDYFMRGDYCDIPPIHMDDLYNMLGDRKESHGR